MADGSVNESQTRTGLAERPSAETAHPHERQTLALDALAKLTRQFSARPDFDHLINVILMTLCGQFAVANSFAVLKKPRLPGAAWAFYGTGRFKADTALKAVCQEAESLDWLGADGQICRVCDLKRLVGSARVISALAEADVAVLCQVVHMDAIVGAIGLGRKVSTKPYTAKDLGLIHSVINTITPLIANTYMFWEMVNLNAEHLDIINSVRQGIFVFDHDCRLKRINSAGLGIVKPGSDSDQGPLKDAPIEMVFPPAVFAGWAQQLRDAIAGESRCVPKSLVVRRGGADHAYSVGLSGAATGAARTVVLTLDDVTAEKQAEHRLYDLDRTAAATWGAGGESFEETLHGLAAGLDGISSALASGDVPEANAAVASLKSLLAGQGCFAPGPQDVADIAGNMQKGNLNSVVSDVLSFVKVQQRYKQLAISLDLDFALPDMILNPDQIAVVLLNLLSNARDAIGESGRADGSISVRTICRGGEAVLVVSDNGAGVEPSIAARLFKEQVTGRATGRGCGLVICGKIIGAHGGEASVESCPGRGTSISVRFPVKAAAGRK
ncbi:MAG TPA: ATP-binding protein [bacterium]|nr:ATP-binding protein [bacterium]